MQFKSFHWLSYHGVVNVHVIWGEFIYILYIFLFILDVIFWGFSNKTVKPFTLVGYEITIDYSQESMGFLL